MQLVRQKQCVDIHTESTRFSCKIWTDSRAFF